MNAKRLIPSLAAAALVGSVGSVQAADINMTGWAFGAGHAVNVAVPTYNGQGGAFKGVLSNAGVFNNTNFITYCVELTESFSLPSNMTGFSIVSGASYFAGSIASKLGKLMTYAYSNPTLVDSVIESGALQLAIWNTIYDTDSLLGVGTFKNTSDVGGVNAIANSFLANAAATTSIYNVLVLTKQGTQDFILLQRVPTPGSLALAALAMGLLWGVRRRA